jgi:hypothetical protein
LHEHSVNLQFVRDQWRYSGGPLELEVLDLRLEQDERNQLQISRKSPRDDAATKTQTTSSERDAAKT